MTNFTLNPGMVRGDLFSIREGGGGKWKYTVQLDMTQYYDDPDIQQAVIKAFFGTVEFIRGVKDGTTGYQLVVLEPYHRNSYPVCVVI